ncbi:hypothetical protein [Vibrio phage phiKT1024]|nr:hypothetical protein [Vibrio phage phiKT1024]
MIEGLNIEFKISEFKTYTSINEWGRQLDSPYFLVANDFQKMKLPFPSDIFNQLDTKNIINSETFVITFAPSDYKDPKALKRLFETLQLISNNKKIYFITSQTCLEAEGFKEYFNEIIPEYMV